MERLIIGIYSWSQKCPTQTLRHFEQLKLFNIGKLQPRTKQPFQGQVSGQSTMSTIFEHVITIEI